MSGKNVKIYKISEFDPSKLTIGKMQTNQKTGAKSVSVLYEGSPMWAIQTPRLPITYDFGEVKKDKDGKEEKPRVITGDSAIEQFPLNLSLRGYKDDRSVSRFYQILQAIDKLVLDNCMANSYEWVKIKKDQANEDNCRSRCPSIIKFATDEEGNIKEQYPPSVRAKGGVKFSQDGTTSLLFSAYFEDHEAINDFNLLKSVTRRNAEVRGAFRCNGVYFIQGNCYFTWKVHQVMVYRQAQQPEYGIVDTDEEETESQEESSSEPAQPPQPQPQRQQPTAQPSVQQKQAMVADDDDDSESDAESGAEEKDELDDSPVTASPPVVVQPVVVTPPPAQAPTPVQETKIKVSRKKTVNV